MVEEETLSSQLMPIILGLITDSILDSVTELGMSERILVVTGMGVLYAVLYVSRKKSKKPKYKQEKLKVPEAGKKESEPKSYISRKVTRVLILGLVIAIVLVGFASAVLGVAVRVIIQLVGWLVLMMLFIFSGNFAANVNTALFLRGIAAVSLGGALSIGGVPTYEFFTAEPVELTIQNYCSTPIVYDLLNIEVPGNTVQTVMLKPLVVTFTREGNHVYVYALCHTVMYSVPEDAFVSFNGQVIRPGDSLTVDLSEQKQHEFFIKCESES